MPQVHQAGTSQRAVEQNFTLQQLSRINTRHTQQQQCLHLLLQQQCCITQSPHVEGERTNSD
jgi:hypothetical protein